MNTEEIRNMAENICAAVRNMGYDSANISCDTFNLNPEIKEERNIFLTIAAAADFNYFWNEYYGDKWFSMDDSPQFERVKTMIEFVVSGQKTYDIIKHSK